MENMNYIIEILQCFDMRMSILIAIEETQQAIEKLDLLIEQLGEEDPIVDETLDAQIDMEEAIESFHRTLEYLSDEINVGIELRY